MDQFTTTILLLIFFLFHVSASAPDGLASNLDYNQLVYKHCDNKTSRGDQDSLHSSVLSAFFQELLQGSMQSTFFQTNAGDDNMAISGLFQCRGDLSSDDCHKCVRKLPEVLKNLCGSSIPAQVQLSGCHIHYHTDGIFQISRLQLLHKTCSDQAGSSAFQQERDAAFSAIQECVQGDQRYCDLNYESVHLMAQCDGNLEACDCIECINNAMDIAQEECGDSVSGDIYMDGCHISYNYYDYGINNGANYGGTSSNKIVAIVVGGIVAVSVAVALCYICRSQGKKDEF